MIPSLNGQAPLPHRLWPRWTVNCGTGELLGIAAAAVIVTGYRYLLGESSSTDDQLLHLFFMALAGVAEGSALAYFQYRMIEKVFPQVAWKQWLAYTVAAALVGWIVGILPSQFLTGGLEADAFQSPEPLVYYSLAALMGLLLGALFGYFQWLPIKGMRKNALLWVPANALGWAAGMVFIFMGASLPGESASWPLVLLYGAIGGALGGLSVGGVTGWFLLKIAASE
ncbi:MAG: hypothetical protein GVY26_21380 [Bacteroidetes bacterium]|nr:hypothetical protein [Bacteroidota bacterium]